MSYTHFSFRVRRVKSTTTSQTKELVVTSQNKITHQESLSTIRAIQLLPTCIRCYDVNNIIIVININLHVHFHVLFDDDIISV